MVSVSCSLSSISFLITPLVSSKSSSNIHINFCRAGRCVKRPINQHGTMMYCSKCQDVNYFRYFFIIKRPKIKIKAEINSHPDMKWNDVVYVPVMSRRNPEIEFKKSLYIWIYLSYVSNLDKTFPLIIFGPKKNNLKT